MGQWGIGDEDIEVGEEAHTLVPPFKPGAVIAAQQGMIEREITLDPFDGSSLVIVGAKDVKRLRRNYED